MSKQYIHKPTGNIYKLNGAGGLIRVDGSTNASLPLWLRDNSCDWEEITVAKCAKCGAKIVVQERKDCTCIKPKEWEITAFRDKRNTECVYRMKNGLCYWAEDRDCFTEKNLLEDSLMEIYSVKRLSDGVEFKIGEKAYCKGIEWLIINEFKIEGNKMKIRYDIAFNFDLNELIKKEKLFTTEDGVDIYEGNKVWWADEEDDWGLNNITASKNNCNGNYPKFSTEKAAEEYILMNKPCLSAKDVGTIYPTATMPIGKYKQTLKIRELVKSKL